MGLTKSRRDARRSTNTAPRKASLASRLASWAGLAEPVGAEPLEARQLLFSLTVTADAVNPNTGIGQVSAYFAYVLPHIATSATRGTATDTIIAEPFDDEAPGVVGSGRLFADSAIRTSHNITPPGDYVIQPNDAQAQNRWLRAAPNNAGEFFAFEFYNDPDNPTRKVQATGFSMLVQPENVLDNTGLLPANFIVRLFRNNVQVAAITGPALQAMFTAGPAGTVFNPALGLGQLTIDLQDANNSTFDTVRFEVTSFVGGNPAFLIDDMTYTVPAGNNAALVNGLVFGAGIVLTGPVGAQIVVEDLYGRDMRRTLEALGADGTSLPLIDMDDNGIADYNYGIGRIRVLNSDMRTSVSVWGGTIETVTGEEDPPDAELVEGGFAFFLADDVVGIYNDFESAGFGYAYRVNQGNVVVTGLPPGPGSVVIGSPFIRPINGNPYANLQQNPVITGFTNANQGIFVENGSISSILVHGILHGSSRVFGAIERFDVGYMVGSLTVEGDLGRLMVGSDLGQWSPDPDFNPAPNTRVDQNNKTGSQVIVGRTLGEVAAAGRGMADILVVGDINSPITRPSRDIAHYYEKEFVFGVSTDTADLEIIRTLLRNGLYVARSPQDTFRGADQPVIFGPSFYRNDTIMGAEWIGSLSTGVRISGELSGQDPFNGEDTNDVFAFAVDGTQELVVEGINDVTRISPYFRIVDQEGRTLAAPKLPATSGRFTVSQLRWKPTAAGVYYLVITDPNGVEDGAGNSSYTVNITGLAPMTFGAYRTGGGSGFTDAASGEGNSITVLSGNMGAVRVGTGFVGDDGADALPLSTYNTNIDADASLTFQGGTFTIPGTLYNITAGSDIGYPASVSSIVFRIGGDLVSMVTGLNPLVGGGPGEGDVNFLDLSVGGSIGTIDIRGGIGMDQDETDPRARVGLQRPVLITTGTAGGRGDIGYFRTGFHIGGDTLIVRTSPGSTIGAFLTSQDAYNDGDPRSGVYLGQRGVQFITGAGSDVRFVDLMRLDTVNTVDAILPIIGDQPLDLVDDGGARIRIFVEGAAPGVQVGTVRVFPIDGSQGVAIGQINVNLGIAGILRIQPAPGSGGQGNGVVGIGHINVTGSTAASSIIITGGIEVDILRIDAGALDQIINQTPGGDIVAAVVTSLNRLDIRGNLGYTQFPALGPLNYSVPLDPAGFVPAGLMDNDYNGNALRPLNDDDFSQNNAYMDDLGGPLDWWLNGLFVAGGDVQQVRVEGAVGDVLLGGGTSTLVLLTANADRITPLGQFHGIVGTILAANITRIEIGDGLATPTGPMASAGIFALDDITEITSLQASGVRFSGVVTAGNAVDPDLPGVPGDGIDRIILSNATVRDAFIASQNLDGFWASFNFTEEDLATGDIQRITLTNTDLFRSRVRGRVLDTLTLTGGYFDASELVMSQNIGIVTALGYRNSTLLGTENEVRLNRILGGRDLRRLVAVQDISDLVVDLLGKVTENITAVNITRSAIDVDNELKALVVTNDLRGSDINVGSLPMVTIARNMQSSTVSVSGALTTFTVNGLINNGRIEVTGPDGAIGTITAVLGIYGNISASGPIGTVRVTNGDLKGLITTTTTRGNVTLLQASRDVAIQADISGNLATITAGRHLGSRDDRGVILVRGNLATASAPNGQLYADLRVGEAITGVITLGGATNKPGNNLVGEGSIIAFRSIASVIINGDFDGDILSYTGGIASVAINNGSLLPGNTIAAYDGNITSLIITNGNLYGNVHADYELTLLRVVAGADGVFGDIGINPAMDGNTSYDARRNQVPAGVEEGTGYQGPRISAGFNIVAVVVTNGSVFESSFVAGRVITSISITGGVANDTLSTGKGSFFAAGDLIDTIAITGSVADASFISGLVALGADNRPGGVNGDADIIKSGSITRVTVGGNIRRSTFSAGMNAGADGLYNTSDDVTAIGLSTIGTLSLGSVSSGVSVYGDTLSSSVSNDTRFAKSTGGVNSLLDSGTGTPGTQFSGSQSFSYSGATVTLTLAGPGTAFFNTSTGRLTLRNTTSASNLTVSSSTGTIANFSVVTGDDASLGTLALNAALTGNSNVVVDGAVTTATFGAVNSTGQFIIGGDVGTWTFASLAGGHVGGRAVTTFRVNGNFGADNSITTGEASVKLLNLGTGVITGTARAPFSVDRNATSIAVSGAMDRAQVRVGGNLGAFSAASASRSIVNAGNNLTTVTIGGEAFATSIVAGLDLGQDAAFGGTGLNADTLSTGFIGTVTVNGHFRESNVVAGYARGADGFFGSTDDTIASGRSSIGTVTITGNQLGSTRGSESYRIASTGTITLVRIGGATFTGSSGNFAREALNLPPAPVQVKEIITGADAGQWRASLMFNQPIDASSFAPALQVYEVRGSGDVLQRLAPGLDYTVSYDVATNAGVVQFARAVSDANLPQVSGRPGPGIYRFVLDQTKFRAKLSGQTIDGNADGFAQAGENYSDEAIVGDVGDKFTAGSAFNNGNAAQRVDFYAPADLNRILDNNYTPDGLPDPNKVYTVRGFIGDHPDVSTNYFSFASDVDLYSLTLQAGQILRLGALQGPAQLAGLTIFGPSGVALSTLIDNATATSLPVPAASVSDVTFPSAYLIRQTGTYTIAVGNAATVAATSTIPNIPIPPSGIGGYHFTLEVADDGNSGFTSTTDSGDGDSLVPAPAPIAFAGVDGVFGTSDDPAQIVIDTFTFTHSRGADNAPNTADDVVTGVDGRGLTSTRTGAGAVSYRIDSAIGRPGSFGVPSKVEADVDIFHLNNRQPISPGTRMKITVKLNELGADLGSASPPSGDRASQRLFIDNRGAVQFALFDTSNSGTLDDATLVFSPTDFTPNGGKPNTVLADNGVTKYGFDASGDFYIEFVSPDRTDVPGAGASLAVYLQGVFNTDYRIDITLGGTPGEITKSRQNVFIETNGGSVNWLEVGGVATTLAPFLASTLGFAGAAPNGQPVQTYILGQLTNSLNSLFQGATTGPGLDVRFSTNPADFEGEQFSTVFLSSKVDPITPLFDPFSSFNFSFLSQQLQTTQPYGFAQHSDPFNANVEDEAVVFVPSFALLGLTPSQVDMDAFVQSLTGAVARRVGELVGLRISANNGNGVTAFDPTAADAVENRPGPGRAYTLPNLNRDLSSSFDTVTRTDFFLGKQNVKSLLDRIISPF